MSVALNYWLVAFTQYRIYDIQFRNKRQGDDRLLLAQSCSGRDNCCSFVAFFWYFSSRMLNLEYRDPISNRDAVRTVSNNS